MGQMSIGYPAGDSTRRAMLGIGACAFGSLAAIGMVPGDPQPEGALFWSALCSILGLLSVPILQARRETAVLMRCENFLMLGLVYWLLLDPLQGAYPLDGISSEDASIVFASIGLMSCGIWLGLAGKA